MLPICCFASQTLWLSGLAEGPCTTSTVQRQHLANCFSELVFALTQCSLQTTASTKSLLADSLKSLYPAIRADTETGSANNYIPKPSSSGLGLNVLSTPLSHHGDSACQHEKQKESDSLRREMLQATNSGYRRQIPNTRGIE